MITEILDEQISFYEENICTFLAALDNIIETSEYSLTIHPHSKKLKLAIEQLNDAKIILNKLITEINLNNNS